MQLSFLQFNKKEVFARLVVNQLTATKWLKGSLTMAIKFLLQDDKNLHHGEVNLDFSPLLKKV